MVIRGWGSAIAAAVGVAAAAGAAQLGVAYGTGVVSWPVEPDPAADQVWVTSLAWGMWIAASCTIVGAVTAARLRTPGATPATDLADEGDRATRVLWRLVLAVAAAVGAMITVALLAVRAREAVAAVAASPQSVAAGYAVLGVVLGLLLAVGALAARAVATNLIATAAWLWLLAVVIVAEGVISGREQSPVPLGFADVELGEVWFRSILLPDAGLALGAALVIGALAALPAARRGDHPVGVAVSGATGPLLLAAAYLMAQPDLATLTATELSRYLTAPYLALAGLAGSLLVSAVPVRRDQSHSEEPTPTAVPAARTPAAVS